MAATDTEPADMADDELERVPGGGDMWFFVMFESLVFAVLYIVR
jgi:hypothetical protein